MRERAPATEIRELKRDLNRARLDVRGLAAQVKTWIDEAGKHRARATKAEQEVAEWKRRFDLLLARTPEVKP